EPDYEVLGALRPGMATIPGALLLCASSPYARRGALWDAHRKHYGQDGDPILVWRAPTRVMNPTVPQAVIDRALADDPGHGKAEWLAQFRSDIEAFISREAVQAVVSPGTRERAHRLPICGTSASSIRPVAAVMHSHWRSRIATVTWPYWTACARRGLHSHPRR